MKNKLLNGQHLSLNEQVNLLTEFVMTIEGMPQILEEITKFPNAWVGAGIIFQNVWNVIHGYELNTYVKDIDVLYWDDNDLTWASENNHIRLFTEIFPKTNIPFDIKNIARVHIWYEQRFAIPKVQYHSIEESIATWPVIGACLAMRMNKDQLEFPLFIKPSDGSRSVDTFFIRTKEDLTDYHFQNEKFMFLEYIDQTKFVEYTCDLYYNKEGELKCAVPRKRIEVRDGEVSKGKTTKNELLTLIKKKLSKIEGVRGCLTAQFFFNEETKRIVAIEINPRFGGGYPLSYRAGANFPKMLMEEYFMNKKIKYFENWKKNLLMLRYDDEVLIENYVE